MKKQLVGLSLFAGGGLMSVGLRMTGVSTANVVAIKPRKKKKGGK